MIKKYLSLLTMRLKTSGVLLRYSINILLSVGIFIFTYFRFKALGLYPLEETVGYSEGGWLLLAVALIAAVPALFGRYVFSGFVLLGYIRGGNAERYYGSEYLPNLGENTKAIFILAVFV